MIKEHKSDVKNCRIFYPFFSGEEDEENEEYTNIMNEYYQKVILAIEKYAEELATSEKKTTYICKSSAEISEDKAEVILNLSLRRTGVKSKRKIISQEWERGNITKHTVEYK